MYLLNASIAPWLCGLYGASSTCLIPLFSKELSIFLFQNSFPLSVCKISGRPIIKTDESLTLIYSLCLLTSGYTHAYLLKWLITVRM